MSWAEIKKAINSDFSTPLNTLITNFLNNSTYGLKEIKNQVVKNQNWYAKYGTTTTLGSKTTTTTGTSNEKADRTKYVTLLTVDIPEDGVYQWSVNTINTGASTTASGTSSDYSSGLSVEVEMASTAAMGLVDADNSTNAYKVKSFTITPGKTQSGSGYIYLNKGMRVYLRLEYNSTSIGAYYQWVTAASAYIKYVKQTV